jgi:hypothetical protein
MSLWECDTGSNLSLAVEWAADSSAVRLMGCTKSFTRWRWLNSGGRFDLLYDPATDEFYDVLQARIGERSGKSRSNYVVNATALASRRLQGKRHASRPARYHAR